MSPNRVHAVFERWILLLESCMCHHCRCHCGHCGRPLSPPLPYQDGILFKPSYHWCSGSKILLNWHPHRAAFTLCVFVIAFGQWFSSNPNFASHEGWKCCNTFPLALKLFFSRQLQQRIVVGSYFPGPNTGIIASGLLLCTWSIYLTRLVHLRNSSTDNLTGPLVRGVLGTSLKLYCSRSRGTEARKERWHLFLIWSKKNVETHQSGMKDKRGKQDFCRVLHQFYSLFTAHFLMQWLQFHKRSAVLHLPANLHSSWLRLHFFTFMYI